MTVFKNWMDSYRKINLQARASLWFLFANVFQKAVMIIFTPVFTRVMTTEEFSKYAVFQSWEVIFTVFAALNISSYATAKALVDIKDDKDSFILSSEVLTIVLTLASFCLYLFVRVGLGKLADLPIPIMAGLFFDIIFVAIYNFWSQNERYHMRYKALVFTSVLIGLFSPIFAFILILYADRFGLYKGWARIISVILVNGIIGIYLFIISLKNSKYKLTTKYWGYCLKYCIPLIPHFLAAAFLQKASQLFVDNYAGANASGIFSLANSLALMMMVFNDALTKTLVPWTYKKLSEKKYRDINGPICYSLLAIGILDLMMCLAAPEIVYIFADKAYTDAVYAIPPLVGVCFFAFLYNAYTNIEYYYQETLMVSGASIIAGISIIVLEYLAVPRWGFVAAGYSALISYIIYAFMHYLFMKKTIKKHIPNENIYNNKAIFILSIAFLLCLILMPMLYKYWILRYMIILLVILGVLMNAKKITSRVKTVLNKKQGDESHAREKLVF